ncbi:MAG: hypothetical protein ABI963_04260 [Rhizomicrobium sp.]
MKPSKPSAADLLFGRHFVNRSKPEKDADVALPKAFVTRSGRPAGTMHLPRKA